MSWPRTCTQPAAVIPSSLSVTWRGSHCTPVVLRGRDSFSTRLVCRIMPKHLYTRGPCVTWQRRGGSTRHKRFLTDWCLHACRSSFGLWGCAATTFDLQSRASLGCNAKEGAIWRGRQHTVRLYTCMNSGCCSLEYTTTPLRRSPATSAGRTARACSWYGPVAGPRRQPSWSRQCIQRTRRKQPTDCGVGQRHTHGQYSGACTATRGHYSALFAPYQHWLRPPGRRPRYLRRLPSDGNNGSVSGNGDSWLRKGGVRCSSRGQRLPRHPHGDLALTRTGHSPRHYKAVSSATTTTF